MPHSILAGDKETAVTIMDIAASQWVLFSFSFWDVVEYSDYSTYHVG